MTATRRSSQSDANTAASGVRAPASKFGIERFSEPHETYDEKKPPTMFDSPWPRNSRLASMCWPERAATALAIEIDWPRATIVSAKAMPTQVGQQRAGRTPAAAKCGQIAGIGPTTATRWRAAGTPRRSRTRARSRRAGRAACAASAAAAVQRERRRDREARRRRARPAPPDRRARRGARRALPSRCAVGAGRPSRSGSA